MQVNGGAVTVWKGGEKKEEEKGGEKTGRDTHICVTPRQRLIPVRTSRHSMRVTYSNTQTPGSSRPIWRDSM